MKIFVLTCLYPEHNAPIAGSFVKENCKLLRRMGHQVTVLNATAYNPMDWLRHISLAPKEYFDESGKGFVMHRMGILDTKLPRYAVASFRFCAKHLYHHAVEREGKPDLLLAHFSFPAGFVAREIGEKEHIPFAVIEHYSLFLRPDILPYIRRLLQKTIVESAAFICVSDSLKRCIVNHAGLEGNVRVIPNAIASHFSYVPAPTTKPFVFFCAGGTRPSKRTELLIDAFKKAFLPYIQVLLVIAGNGKAWGKIHEKAGDDSRIRIVGQLNREQMRGYFSACHCYVMPSIYETFGIVYREAMASGRPVISAKNGGIEEGWDNSFGILVERDDIEGLAKALRDMYFQYDSYDKLEISKKCLSSYGENVVSQQYNTILSTIDAKSRGVGLK